VHSAMAKQTQTRVRRDVPAIFLLGMGLVKHMEQ
jgi:hypothetical protein